MSEKKVMLSVIMITKNAERKLDACLKAVRSIADEIIIVDSGSVDATLTIARQYTDQIFELDWPGFGLQKQRALDRANGEWILSLDADEVLTPALCDSIRTMLRRPKCDGYTIKRTWVIGKKSIKYADSSKPILRLFKKEKARFTEDVVHEKVLVNGSVGDLVGEMLHYSVGSMHDWMVRLNDYTTLTARKRQERKKNSSLLKAVFSASACFVKFYIIKRGFLDGRMGFVVSVNWALGSYCNHMKLATFDDF